MHNYGIQTSNLVHTFRRHYHCTASVNTSVLHSSLALTGPGIIYIYISTSMCSFLSRVTWRLVSDVRRGTRCAVRAGHDVAGPGLHLEVRSWSWPQRASDWHGGTQSTKNPIKGYER
jgi:hypothetical protein